MQALACGVGGLLLPLAAARACSGRVAASCGCAAGHAHVPGGASRRWLAASLFSPLGLHFFVPPISEHASEDSLPDTVTAPARWRLRGGWPLGAPEW